ncbi:hypothetical protein [Terrabacter sp. 2YAF2]|uniref:hypothetical protein n=1 Tax=Terrabacter sp. 2YAF2 TaxID=3233026 RepID=UPI003F9A38F5
MDEEIALTLVLDDLQHLDGSGRALEMLDHFMTWAPPSSRVLLASRSMPRLRLQKLRLDSTPPTTVNDWGDTLTEREQTILRYLGLPTAEAHGAL